LREPMFRKKTENEGVGYTVNNSQGLLVTIVFCVWVVGTSMAISALVADEIAGPALSTFNCLFWAGLFILFAKRESDLNHSDKQ